MSIHTVHPFGPEKQIPSKPTIKTTTYCFTFPVYPLPWVSSVLVGTPSCFYSVWDMSPYKGAPWDPLAEQLSQRRSKRSENGCNEPFLQQVALCTVLRTSLFLFHILRRCPLQPGWLIPPLTQKSTCPTWFTSPRNPAFVCIICTWWASSFVNRKYLVANLSISGLAGSSPAEYAQDNEESWRITNVCLYQLFCVASHPGGCWPYRKCVPLRNALRRWFSSLVPPCTWWRSTIGPCTVQPI